jgi:predicted N-acetyltransferase YhbS
LPGPDRSPQKGAGSKAVIVRPANPEDAAALVELQWTGAIGAYDEDPVDLTPYRTALLEIDETPRTEMLVAERDDQVIGTCQLIPVRHLQNRGGRCAEIESMHVAPDLLGTGTGGSSSRLNPT